MKVGTMGLGKAKNKYMLGPMELGKARWKAEVDQDGYDAYSLANPSAIARLMSLVEDYTPIKPVMGKNLNSFEDGMFNGTLFGVPHSIVWGAIVIGIILSVFKIIA